MSWLKKKLGPNKKNKERKRSKSRENDIDVTKMKRGDSDNQYIDEDDFLLETQNNQYYNAYNENANQNQQQPPPHHNNGYHNNNNQNENENQPNYIHDNQSARIITKNHRRVRQGSAGQADDKLYVGDKILLANKRSGKVTSLGPKPDKDGIWVRVVMDSSHMNANSVWEDSKTKNKTIWVPIQRVDRIISHGKKFNLTIGDRVIERKKRIHGTVRYVGPTHFEKGVWFGVELDQAKGKNNGTVKKKFYFRSQDNHGVMLPYKRLDSEDMSISTSKKKTKSPKKHRSQSQNFEKEKKKVNGYNKKTKHTKTNSDGLIRSNIHNTNNIHIHSQSLHIEEHLKNNHNNHNNHNNNHMNHNGNINISVNVNNINNNNNNHNNHSHNIPPQMNGHNNHHISNNIIIQQNNNDPERSPSSELDPVMYNPLRQTTIASPPKAAAVLTPKEKNPFLGFKCLVHDDDDSKDTPSPSPLPLPYDGDEQLNDNVDIMNGFINPNGRVQKTIELDEVNLSILSEFLMESKKFEGLEKKLYESQLPSITEVQKEEREKIFIQKLILCQAKCDFFDSTDKMMELIEKKEKMLLELSEFIARHVWFKESLYEKCLLTVSKNLFRALPYQDRPPALSFFNDEVFDKDTNFEDPAWRHLKLVYDLTWRVINTPQVTAAMMEKHMTGQFIGSLVELFASEDHRERAYLMMILHKIYGRCLKLRPYIIQIMSGYFYRMIYADEFQHVNGIIELLQIICAIIPGLTVPVKDSWQSFVRNILVPLHKCRGLKKFWEQLTQCCVNYVAKDEDGGAVILGGLLKFWPQQSPQKEEIFIMEVVNIINVLITHQHGFSYENYKEVLVAAANKLTSCMLSTRQPVAERAIAAWKEQSMQRLVDYDRKAFLPKLCEAFYRNRDHPNVALKQSSTAVEKIYRSKDSAYWKKMQQYLAKKEKKETAILKAINDAQIKNKDPYDIVKAKHAKDKSKNKRPKPLTTAEKKAKRIHYWAKVRQTAQKNEKLFQKHQESKNHRYQSHQPHPAYHTPPHLNT